MSIGTAGSVGKVARNYLSKLSPLMLTTAEEKLKNISTKLDELVQNSKEPSLSKNTNILQASLTPKTLAAVTNE